MKVITVCGSLKFKNEIMHITEKMTLQGYCILSIIYPTKQDKDLYADDDIDIFAEMHKERIKMSDAILVVNINNYMGESTRKEIDFAKSQNKEIIYYSDIMNL